MESQIDISVARIVHLDLEASVATATSNTGTPRWHAKHPFPGCEACELGRWLSRYRQEPHIPTHQDLLYQLIPVHEQFHRVAQAILTGMETPVNDVMQHALAADRKQLRDLSHEIIFLLTSIELHLLHEQHRSAWHIHPLGFLHRLFDDHHPIPSANNELLDIGHARLVHLRWVEDLPKAFRDRGRHAFLESDDSCALGEWIQNVGLRRYPNIQEMVELDNVHQAFHERAESAVRALRRRQDEQAEQAYAAMKMHSRDVIYLLSVIENKLLGEAALRRTANTLK